MKLFIAACLLAVSLAQTDTSPSSALVNTTNSNSTQPGLSLSTSPTSSPTTSTPSSHPTTSPTSPPTTSPSDTLAPTIYRLLDNGVHHACVIPVHYDSTCSVHTIIDGTTCKIWFVCPEHMYPIPVMQTCQQDGSWIGDALIPQCHADPCPEIEGFQMFTTGGCDGRNELGVTYESVSECVRRCENEDACISAEYSKPVSNHPEPNRCSISTSCDYYNSRDSFQDPYCLYVKNRDVNPDGLTPHSNNDGETIITRHCALDGDLLHYITDCDGTILARTVCSFRYACKESEHSVPVKLVCQEDGQWGGVEMDENGEMKQLDPNCHDSGRPTHTPTENPFVTPSPLREEDVCSDSCANPEICRVCYGEKSPAQPCSQNSEGCPVEITVWTQRLLSADKCVSVSSSKEICASKGGMWNVELSGCITESTETETCTTKGEENGVSRSGGTNVPAGYKACPLKYAFWCDPKDGVGFRKYIRIEVVHQSQPCPSLQDHWSLSCNLEDPESNTLIPPDPPDPTDSSDSGCLNYDSEISLPNGLRRPIHSLQVGTHVAIGNDAYSPIVLFTHFDKIAQTTDVVTIKTQETNITATPNHLIFSSENEDVSLRNLRAFEQVKVGDYVLMDSVSGPVSTKVTHVIFRRVLTRIFNAVPRAGYFVANNIFVTSGVAFWVLPHWLQYPVVHTATLLICGISERVCQIEENEIKPKWVRAIQGCASSAGMMIARSHV